MPNSHITQYLDYYIQLQEPEFAVLLSGPWGSGKTWFIKQYVKNRPDAKFLHVSLYGKNSADEIDAEIFAQLYPKLAGKGSKFISVLAKGAVKGWLKVDIGDAKLSDYLEASQNNILIFDDVERCSMPISDVLGYINLYVEYQGFKVILLANEDILKVRFTDETGKAEHTDYKKIKEKLIGKTFSLTAQTSDALASFLNTQSWDSATIGQSKTFLRKHIHVIEVLYRDSDTHSLRILKQSIDEFTRFYSVLEPDIKGHQELPLQLLNLFLALSFETRKGRVQADEIADFLHAQTTITHPYGADEKELEKEKAYRMLWEKYRTITSLDMILGIELWVEIIGNSRIDARRINPTLKNSRYFQAENESAIEKIYSYQSLNDDEFLKLRQDALNELNSGWAKEKDELIYGLGVLLWLHELNLIQTPVDELLKAAQANADKLFEGKTFEELESILGPKTPYDGFAWNTKLFVGTSHAAARQLVNYIDEKAQTIMLELFKKESFKFFSQDSDIKFQANAMLSDPHNKISLIVPLLTTINQSEFVEAFITAPYFDQAGFLHALNRRFKMLWQLNRHQILAEEAMWVEDVKSQLQPFAQAKSGLPSGVRLEQAITQGIEPALAIAASTVTPSSASNAEETDFESEP